MPMILRKIQGANGPEERTADAAVDKNDVAGIEDFGRAAVDDHDDGDCIQDTRKPQAAGAHSTAAVVAAVRDFLNILPVAAALVVVMGFPGVPRGKTKSAELIPGHLEPPGGDLQGTAGGAASGVDAAAAACPRSHRC